MASRQPKIDPADHQALKDERDLFWLAYGDLVEGDIDWTGRAVYEGETFTLRLSRAAGATGGIVTLHRRIKGQKGSTSVHYAERFTPSILFPPSRFCPPLSKLWEDFREAMRRIHNYEVGKMWRVLAEEHGAES